MHGGDHSVRPGTSATSGLTFAGPAWAWAPFEPEPTPQHGLVIGGSPRRTRLGQAVGSEGDPCPAVPTGTPTATYDSADRLMTTTGTTAAAWTYDPFGRTPSVSPWLLAAFALWGVLFLTWQPFAWWRMVAGVVFLLGAGRAALRRSAWWRRRK